MLLRIRCFGYERAGRQFVTDDEVRAYGERVGDPADTPAELGARYTQWGGDGRWSGDPPPRPVRTEGGLFSLPAPLTGLFAAWRANMVYRADERVDAVRGGFDLLARARGHGPVRFTAHVIESEVRPSLNWELTPDTCRRIHLDVERTVRAFAQTT